LVVGDHAEVSVLPGDRPDCSAPPGGVQAIAERSEGGEEPMSWTRKHTLATGLALIAVTNAVALLGAAWNRSGEEARLALTQRELLRPYPWYGNRENSGISLTLVWRVQGDGPDRPLGRYTRIGGQPPWLDRAKMGSLGF